MEKSLKSVYSEKTDDRSNVTKKRSLNVDRSVYSMSLSKEQKWFSDRESFLLSDRSGTVESINHICSESATSDLLSEVLNTHVKPIITHVCCCEYQAEHTHSTLRHSLLCRIFNRPVQTLYYFSSVSDIRNDSLPLMQIFMRKKCILKYLNAYRVKKPELKKEFQCS